MTPKQKKFNIIANEPVFAENANPELVSDFLKGYQETPSPIKGYSKKTQSYKTSIVSSRQRNYDGKWYENGWIINNKNQVIADKVETIPFMFGERYLRPINELPYSKLGTTGVYVDLVWSGYNPDGDPRLASGLRPDLRICGFINSGVENNYKEVMPYRNLFEIFDHKDVQVGDMGNRWFHTGEGRVKGEFIAKNDFYFLSGIGPEDFLNPNTKLLIFSDHIKGRETVSEGRQLPEPIAFYWYPERQNTTRFSIFAFTGDLNLKYVPLQTNNTIGPKTRQIAGGNLYQYKNSKWGIGDFRIELTGVYPEKLSKTFSVANTGDVIVDFYLSPEDSTMEIESNAFDLNSKYIWTNESVRIYPSGTKIQLYNLSSKRNANFDIKINTTGLIGALNTGITKNIVIYQITGEQFISGEGAGTAYKPLTVNKTIPVRVVALTNQTKVKIDDYFFRYQGVSGQNFAQTLPSYANTDGKNTLTFTTGGLNFDTKWFGLTYYSTGDNLNQPEVAADLNRKIKRLDQFSDTGAFSGLKRIYPILSGEAYLYVNSNREWLNIDASEKSLRWLSGVSGFFSSPTSFNPETGALQVDVQIAIKTVDLLPISPNTNGSNFNLTFTGNKLGVINKAYPNNFISNTQNTGFIIMPTQLQKGKTYRFLQTDSTDTSNFTFGFTDEETMNYMGYKVYEPDYNASKDKNYRLITLRIPNDYINSSILFEANNNSTKWTGIFNIYQNTGIGQGKKLNDFSQTYNSSGEWFLFGFEPNYKLLEPSQGFLTFQEVFPTGHFKINNTLSNLKVNNYKNGPYLSTVFYSNVENAIEVLNNFEQDSSNPCYFTTVGNKTVISANRNWWRLKIKNKDGSHTTGCYTHEEFIALSSKVYSERAPAIKVIPGQRYNFVRPAMTNFEITGFQLKFSQPLGNPIINGTGYNPSLVTGTLTNSQILNNYQRKTHQTDPNLLVNLFGDTKTKFFEYITFTVPTGYSIQNTGLKIINYGVNNTGHISNLGSSSLLPFENLTNEDIQDSDYLFTTTPVFSGDIMVRSTDTSRGTDKYTFIVSGVGSAIDHIGRYTNP